MMAKVDEVLNYRRTYEELRRVASMYWPEELSKQAAELSVIPTLLETQEQFVIMLSVDVVDIDGLFGVIRSSRLASNLFLKHRTYAGSIEIEGLRSSSRM